MTKEIKSVQEYINSIDQDKQKPFEELRKIILKNLPKGFEEGINYGMIGYFVPLSIYPEGYHCNPKDPLPFLSIASTKAGFSFYHMGIYVDEKLLSWFEKEYPKYSKTKLDMGKSCIRFKKMDQVPLKLIGELVSKVSVKDWISLYEKNVRKKS